MSRPLVDKLMKQPRYAKQILATGAGGASAAARPAPVAGGGIRIEFEVPVKAVSLLNTREHWTVKQRRARVQRQAAWIVAYPHLRLIEFPHGATITMTRLGGRGRALIIL